ncbi:MAG: ABC transporter permease [Clostridia bacterium]|nr:ABC transporter permease [Clostridia bacterium]
MRKSFDRVATLSKRNIKEIVRDPLSLLFMLGLPLFLEVLFYLIFHTMTSQFEMKYLAPGIAVFAQSFISLFSGLLIALDRSTSFLTRLYVTETRPYEFIFGYLLALLPISAVQSVLFFIVGGLIEPSFWSVGIILGVLMCVVTSVFYIGVGILLGSLCSEKSIGGVSSVVIAGQSVLSGMWFPVEGLSGGMMTVMNVLPFRNATMLVQNMTNGYSDAFSDVLLPLIIVVAYTAVAFVFAVAAFRRNMKRV